MPYNPYEKILKQGGIQSADTDQETKMDAIKREIQEEIQEQPEIENLINRNDNNPYNVSNIKNEGNTRVIEGFNSDGELGTTRIIPIDDWAYTETYTQGGITIEKDWNLNDSGPSKSR